MAKWINQVDNRITKWINQVDTDKLSAKIEIDPDAVSSLRRYWWLRGAIHVQHGESAARSIDLHEVQQHYHSSSCIATAAVPQQ